jgi:hypothetical protein
MASHNDPADRRRRITRAKAVTINIDSALLERLDAHVSAKGGSRSGWITICVLDYLDRSDGSDETPHRPDATDYYEH